VNERSSPNIEIIDNRQQKGTVFMGKRFLFLCENYLFGYVGS